MAECLTRAEIDQLLAVISGLDETPSVVGIGETFEPKSFLTDLAYKAMLPEPRIGMFTKDLPVLSFRIMPHADRILADIQALNCTQGGGSFTIPNSALELFNFSVCPR